jgi:hypothetical protein
VAVAVVPPLEPGVVEIGVVGFGSGSVITTDVGVAVAVVPPLEPGVVETGVVGSVGAVVPPLITGAGAAIP